MAETRLTISTLAASTIIQAAAPGLHCSLCSSYVFRLEDVGKAKAEVAAQRIMQRVDGVTVTPHFGRIEEKPLEFYEQFHIIILGLDSLEARRYMNQIACSFVGELWCPLQRTFHSSEHGTPQSNAVH